MFYIYLCVFTCCGLPHWFSENISAKSLYRMFNLSFQIKYVNWGDQYTLNTEGFGYLGRGMWHFRLTTTICNCAVISFKSLYAGRDSSQCVCIASFKQYTVNKHPVSLWPDASCSPLLKCLWGGMGCQKELASTIQTFAFV